MSLMSTGAWRLAVLALTATFAATAGAQQQWYTVEVIVFDTLWNEGLHAEQWPADPGEPSIEGAVELALPSSADTRAFRLVDRAGLSLSNAWNALRRSERYRPFLHAGWRLPGLRRNVARPAYLGARLAGASRRNGDDLPVVRGTVKVSVARYLQVELDLLYRRSADDAPEGTPAWFRLKSERRMRSRELHYFDHPLFGVLMRITAL